MSRDRRPLMKRDCVGIVMAIGPSIDRTEDVAAELTVDDDEFIVVDNPTGKMPTALNLAIGAGQAPVIVRVDGEGRLNVGYITRAVETLRLTGAGNVGGIQVPIPTTPFEEVVAATTASLPGTSGASYRTGDEEASVTLSISASSTAMPSKRSA